MAFRAAKRKEVKKQSYYVWFLGAKESKGLRGEEYIRPVLHQLLDREQEVEPTKVTLQVSGKGLKIVQNVPRKSNRGKTEQIKHFIPHHAITCAVQEAKPDDDVVCCILLIYNPLTRCPVHVHGYRCDSIETASSLRAQLQALIDRLDNQKKFREIENRLAAKGLIQSRRLNSDGRSTRTDGSDRTEDSFGSDPDASGLGPKDQHVASLYDSLAAELRERLGNPNSCPILLPPKDYDTVSRKRSRLEGIDERRSTNRDLVGPASSVPLRASLPTESGSRERSSSGIGSDGAPGSAIQQASPRFQNKVKASASSLEERLSLLQGNGLVRTECRKSSSPDAIDQASLSLTPSASSLPVSSPPTYLFGQRKPYFTREKSRESPSKSELDNDLATSNGCKDVGGTKGRERQVVYRCRSNPTDNQVPRAFRPFSYPNHQTQEHYRDLRPQGKSVRPKNLVETLTFGSHLETGEEDLSRRTTSPQIRSDRRPSDCQPSKDERSRLHRYDDTRPSGYFDLPVNARDHRHSLAESLSHRLPLGAHY